MGNDIVYGNLGQIDYSINQLENLCNSKQVDNNKEVERILNRLTTENWIGKDSEAFKNKFREYQNNLDKMAAFYQQIISDLKIIRSELEEQMQTKPNIHTDGF